MEISHKETMRALRRCDEKHKAVMLRGATGIGKSAIVSAYAKEKAERLHMAVINWNKMTLLEKRYIAAKDSSDTVKALTPDMVRHKNVFVREGEAEDGSDDRMRLPSEVRAKALVFIDYRLGQVSDTSDFRMPDIAGKQAYVEWKPVNAFHFCSLDDANVVLFFDEFGQAIPQVQSASFQIVLDREVGDIAFGDNVFLVGATNRAEDRANVFEMPVPLRRRFVNYTLRAPSADEWVSWAAENGLDSRVVSFVQNFPDKLSDKLENVVKLKDQGFACPATWHSVSDLCGGIKPRAEDGEAAYNARLNEIRVLASGVIGQAHGELFVGHVKTAATIDYAKLFANPEMIDGWGTDLKWTVICGFAETYRHDKNKLDAMLGVVERLPEDMVALFGRMLVGVEGGRRNVNKFQQRLMKCNNKSVLNKLVRYFSAWASDN